MTKAPAAITQVCINNRFAEIQAYLKENKFDNILLDEVAFQLSPKSEKVLGTAKTKDDF